MIASVTDSKEQLLKYLSKERTSSHHTPAQFRYFNNHKEIGDIIILYENKIGHIYYGKITGEITQPTKGMDLAPDWFINEIQYHIKVFEWTKIENPHMRNFRRKTLSETSVVSRSLDQVRVDLCAGQAGAL